MGYLKPGYWARKYFSLNYWHSRFAYWPGFEVKSTALPLEKGKRKLKIFKHSSRLELVISILSKHKFIKAIERIKINISSEYKLIKSKKENIELLMLDEDVWLAEN